MNDVLTCGTALNYERLNIHQNAFSGQVAPYDALGNP